jgi:peptide deformylase
MAAVNPKILSRSARIGALEDGEGCLSVDQDHPGIVPRSYKIIVEYYDYLKKQLIKETLKGYKAIVFQHEFDHNQGHLYYDLINPKNPEAVQDD